MLFAIILLKFRMKSAELKLNNSNGECQKGIRMKRTQLKLNISKLVDRIAFASWFLGLPTCASI